MSEPLWTFVRAWQIGGEDRASLADGGASPEGWHYLDLSMEDDEQLITVSLDPAAAEELEVALREFRERRP
jgi:hypothetical protein